MNKPNGYWTKETVIAEAKKYTNKADFRKHAGGANHVLSAHPEWRKEAFAHMQNIVSWGESVIHQVLLAYQIPFVHQQRFDKIRDKYPLPFDFYIPSLNLVIEYQGKQHFEDSYRTGKVDFQDRLRKDALKKQGAKRLKMAYLAISERHENLIEKALMQKIQCLAARRGMVISSKKLPVKTNDLQPLGRWTKESVLADARQYNAFNLWRKASPAWQIAWRDGYLKECQAHMISARQVRSLASTTKWTFDACKESAKDFQTRASWKGQYPVAYAKARKSGWLDELCAHMLSGEEAHEHGMTLRRKWDFDACRRSALVHDCASAWQKAEGGAFNAAKRQGWFKELTPHFLSTFEARSRMSSRSRTKRAV